MSELRSFLGIVNYYKFLSNLSTKLTLLYHLLKKGVRWHQKSQRAKAFAKAKRALQGDTLLVHYDSTCPLVLACDASLYSLRAALSHIMNGEKECPVAYASGTLAAAEKNDTQLEREALGVEFTVQKFHNYMYGRCFIIELDHRLLSYILI